MRKKISLIPTPKKVEWDGHLIRTLVQLKFDEYTIPSGTVMKIVGSGTKCFLVGKDENHRAYPIVYPTSYKEISESVEFIAEEEEKDPENHNRSISINEMEAGKFYRVTYGNTHIVGRFRKTNHVNLFWYTPYYHKWEKYESLKNSDWSVISHISSIQLASDEDMARYNDLVQENNKDHKIAS